MNIPSLPIDVPLRENDSVADEPLNSTLPSGRTFESFTEAVEENNLGAAGISEVAASPELDDLNIESGLAIPLNSTLPSGRTFESFTEAVEENNLGAAGISEVAASPELDDLNIESGLAIPLIVQSTGVEPELSVFADITSGTELNETTAELGVLPEMVDALATQTQVVYAMSDEVVVLPADGAEGIDSGLLSGLQAVIGAEESGFEFSQGNENESESTEPNLKAALPGLIQEDSTLLNRGSRTTALTAGKMEAVTETVTENLVQQIRLTERGEQKQMTLQLHPSELGQLTLQLDWDKDVLQVKILASEMVAADLLKQNKSQLVQALAENGIDFDSLDIGYQSEQSDPRDESDAESRFMSGDLFNESEEAKPSQQPVSRASSSMIDIRV